MMYGIVQSNIQHVFPDPTGVLPLDPAVGPSPKPLFCPPLSKFLATPLTLIITTSAQLTDNKLYC